MQPKSDGSRQTARGAREAANQGESSTSDASDGGGLFGKLAGMASSALGGSAGTGLELASSLNSAGVGTDKVGGFVSMVVEFIKEKAGKEVLDQLLAKFPILKTLVG